MTDMSSVKSQLNIGLCVRARFIAERGGAWGRGEGVFLAFNWQVLTTMRFDIPEKPDKPRVTLATN